MSKPDHDAIDAALIDEMIRAGRSARLAALSKVSPDDNYTPLEGEVHYMRAALAVARLAIVLAGESAAGAARDLRDQAQALAGVGCGCADETEAADCTHMRGYCRRLQDNIEGVLIAAAKERDDLRALLVRAGEGMTSVRCTLAALIPYPSAPKTHEWPCENGADREYLQLAYEELTAALSAIRTATQTQETK